MVSAIFLLVALAVLGAAIVNVSTVQHTTSALDVQGTRAYLAGRSGIEWALFNVFVAGSYCGGPAGATNSFSMPSGTTLSDFTVTVVCTPTTYTSATATIAVSPDIIAREITATACNQPASGACPNPNPGMGYVQRVVTVRTVQ